MSVIVSSRADHFNQQTKEIIEPRTWMHERRFHTWTSSGTIVAVLGRVDRMEDGAAGDGSWRALPDSSGDRRIWLPVVDSWDGCTERVLGWLETEDDLPRRRMKQWTYESYRSFCVLLDDKDCRLVGRKLFRNFEIIVGLAARCGTSTGVGFVIIWISSITSANWAMGGSIR